MEDTAPPHRPLIVHNLTFIGPNYYYVLSQPPQADQLVKLDDLHHHKYNSVFSLIATILLSLLQLKYQGGKNPTSPFDTNPLSITFALGGLVLYCLAYAAACFKSSFSSPSSHFYRKMMIMSGCLVLGSLASLFFPKSNMQHYALYAIFFIGSSITLVVFSGSASNNTTHSSKNLLPLHISDTRATKSRF